MPNTTNNDLRSSRSSDEEAQHSSTLSDDNVRFDKEQSLGDESRFTSKGSCDLWTHHPKFPIPAEDLHQEPKNGEHFYISISQFNH